MPFPPNAEDLKVGSVLREQATYNFGQIDINVNLYRRGSLSRIKEERCGDSVKCFCLLTRRGFRFVSWPPPFKQALRETIHYFSAMSSGRVILIPAGVHSPDLQQFRYNRRDDIQNVMATKLKCTNAMRATISRNRKKRK